MSDTVRIKLALFSFSMACILTSNGLGYEVGHWNWGGTLSYVGGVAAGVAIVSHRVWPSPAAGQGALKP